jgi:hypothetical protein
MTKITKKDKIIKRLANGDDPEIIAREEKTSKSYVYKISSTESKRIAQESEEGKNIGQNPTDPSFEDLPQKDGDKTSSLSCEDRKKMYNDIYNDLSEVEIVRKYGWDPAIVKREYEGYYELSRFKPTALQKDLLEAFGIPTEVVEASIKDKLFSNQELIRFIISRVDSAIEYNVKNTIDKMFSPYSPKLPRGWSTVKCGKCGSCVPGLIYNPSLVSTSIDYIFRTSLCQYCHRIASRVLPL